jgi:hypothetical protein
MPSKQPLSPYPVIDADPTFGRVIRYMRPSDYATWAGAAAAGPAAFWGFGESFRVDSLKRKNVLAELQIGRGWNWKIDLAAGMRGPAFQLIPPQLFLLVSGISSEQTPLTLLSLTPPHLASPILTYFLTFKR